MLADAAKSTEKLKMNNDTNVDYVVKGNIVPVVYKGGNGSILAEFDCDIKK